MSNEASYGESIRHREAPQAIQDGRADAALVFYRLGLRYRRVFPADFDFVWPTGSLVKQSATLVILVVVSVGAGGRWGRDMDGLFAK